MVMAGMEYPLACISLRLMTATLMCLHATPFVWKSGQLHDELPSNAMII